jgi:hypothetical protein
MFHLRKQPRGRYWIQTKNYSRHEWLLVCSKDEYKTRESRDERLPIGPRQGCPRGRVILASVEISYASNPYWDISAVDEVIDLWEEVALNSAFAPELAHALKTMQPIRERGRDYLSELKMHRKGWMLLT